MVDPDGSPWRPRAAVADDRPCLNGGYGCSKFECHRYKTPREHPARCDPAAPKHPQMPIMPEGRHRPKNPDLTAAS